MVTSAGQFAEAFLGQPPRPFRSGAPALDLFPVDLWGRLLARAWKRSSPRSLGYGDPAGHPPLRAAIARYLRAARGLACTDDQVVVCAGSQQAIDLVGRVLLDEGDSVWIEDPGYVMALASLRANGQRVVAVPVDEHGLDVEAGKRAAPDAKLVYVTPARQVPLGVVLAETRRRALLDWAAAAGAWIFEDDYDSELQFASRPPAPLRALDRTGRVILAGTFSKVLFPALRLGYIVADAPIARAIARARQVTDIATPLLPQAVLAEFIADGHFERHIRRMRSLYHDRQSLLVRLLRAALGSSIEIASTEAGLNLVIWLPPRMDDRDVAAAAAAAGVDVIAISTLRIQRDRSSRPGLLLGFGGVRDADLADGVSALARVIRAQ